LDEQTFSSFVRFSYRMKPSGTLGNGGEKGDDGGLLMAFPFLDISSG
jgi:hypothetical protein